jgi:hypothetical protein
MAINIPILTEFQDNGIRAAKAAFGNFRTAVGDAEGTMGKFKAGATSAMDAVKANAGLFAIAGAAAFVGFAKKSITAFQDLALEVDKFSIASGMKAEDASRWVEVAGDLGINVEQVQTAMGRMNRTIGEKPNLFRDLGVDLVYAANGSLDVNATFLNTIQHLKDIKDPAERAKEGVKLLGKGWTDMALLIDQGAGNLSKSLASVSDSKIIDQKEIGKARSFRDATNDLKDKIEDLTISLGESLIPAITQAVRAIGPLLEFGGKMVGSIAQAETVTAIYMEGWNASLEDAITKFGALQVMADTGMTALELLAAAGGTGGDAMLYLADMGQKYVEYTKSRIDAINGTTEAITDQGDEVNKTDLKWQALKGTLELSTAMANAKADLADLAEKAIEAYNGADGALGEYEQGLIDAKLMVLNLAESIALTDSQKNQIRVLVDTGDLERALGLIDIITAGGYTPELNAMRFRGKRASGGPVAMGQSYLVGERGPELFTPSTSGNITPNGAMGGNTITVNVNGGDPNSIVRALQQYVRQNGSLSLATTSATRF